MLHIYQNSKLGGIQLQMLNLFKHYDRDLINPVFCCLGPQLEVGREFERQGFDFVALGRTRYSKFKPSIVTDLAALMRDRNIHVLRTHKYRAAFYGRLAARKAKVPVVVCSEHNTYHEKEKRLIRRLTNKALFPLCDVYVGVSEAIRRDLIKYDWLPDNKVKVIRNGVDLSRFDPDKLHADFRAEMDIPKGALFLLCIGRLAENKGYEYLIEAFSTVRAKLQRDVRLVIIGEGSYRDSLTAMIDVLGHSNRITLAGQRTDIPDILASADMFVMPSIEEGLPNAMLEAMSMGLPVVATDVGGIPEALMSPQHGLIVSPREPEALARAIINVASDHARMRAMGEAARRHVIENFSIQRTTERWQNLYLGLLRAKGVIP